METIFRTHQPAWDNVMQLLTSLFSTEERPTFWVCTTTYVLSLSIHTPHHPKMSGGFVSLRRENHVGQKNLKES